MIKWSIQELEDSFLEEKFKRKKQVTDKWRGSDMGSCFRKRYYTRQGIESTEKLDSRIRRVLDVGNLFHWKYQYFLKKIGVLVEKEMEISNEEYNYIGHGDAVVGGKINLNKSLYEFTDKKGEKKLDEKMWEWALAKEKEMKEKHPEGLPYILYDFKTQHSGSFSYLLRDGAQKEHVRQLAGYLTFIDKKKYPVQEGRLLYISKDDSRLLEFPVLLTDSLQETIKQELSELNEYWKKQELPPQLQEITLRKKHSINWKCRFCPYVTHCRGKDWLKRITTKVEVLNKKSRKK